MKSQKHKQIVIILAVLVAVILPAVFLVMLPRTGPEPSPLPPRHVSAADIERNNRGVGLMGRYEYDAAREVFAELAAAHPGWIDARINLAIATLNRQREGDEDRALEILAEVLREEPEHLRARYCTALLLLHAGEAEEAMPHFEFVSSRDPADPFAAYYVGQILASRDPAAALSWFQRAMEVDPYLRSAYYGASQSLMRLDREEEAMELLHDFERLARNPRARLAEFVYTRMGPKAEAIATDPPAARWQPAAPPAPPQGPIFADAEPLLTNGDAFTWRVHRPERAVSITACDITGNGAIDIFIAGVLEGTGDFPGVYNAVCINNGDGTFTLDPDHPLAGIPDVNAALWGDFDNDGLTDVYLCRRGPNMLWRNTPSGRRRAWIDVTDATGTSGGDFDTVDGLFFDADHDGDLDIFLVNADGPNELLNNNRDATPPALPTFKPIAQQQGIAGGGRIEQQGSGLRMVPLERSERHRSQPREIIPVGRGSQQVMAVDLENDRDLDIIVINEEPPHEVYLNDRLWQYRQAGVFFHPEPLLAAAAADTDADGRAELFTVSSGRVEGTGTVSFDGGPETDYSFTANTPWAERWFTDADGQWTKEAFIQLGVWTADIRWLPLIIADIGGTGEREPILVAVNDRQGLHIVRIRTGESVPAVANEERVLPPSPDEMQLIAAGFKKRPPAGAGIAVLDAAAGPSIIAAMPDGPPMILRPGPGRHRFASLSFTGREDAGHAMRSNASGIGTHYAARFGSQWVAGSTLPNHSGPGQSLQPQAVGLAGHRRIDYLSIDWSDGIFQSEIDLAAGEHHVIVETQRQLSSCPVLFAWDGEKYEFVSDVLGVGGIGFAVGPGEYAPSRPWERFMFPEGLLQPKEGRYIIKLGEPMEEACYLDAARLVAYDLPPGWSMTLDERMGIGEPAPTGATRFYRRSMAPVHAANERGEDVTDAVREADLVAAPVGGLDHRFIGLLRDDHVLTIAFPQAIDSHDAAMLIMDGWIEYPYSQTMFAAWQAGAAYRAPTIEALNEDGEWVVVWEEFGYPAGMPREASVPLPLDRLPAGTRTLRITTNQEIYWDRFRIAWAEECPEAVRHELVMAKAELLRSGFAQRIDLPQRLPYYDYERRMPLWDTRHQTGWYTAFGDVRELIAEPNGALAIFGPGEEVHMEFEPPEGAGPGPGAAGAEFDELPDGWTRRFVFETEGWCKDMDLFTKDGDTLEPLPEREGDNEARTRLHEQFNTRFRSDR